MIRELLTVVDLTLWAEAALLLFVGVFVAVSIRTLRADTKTAQRHARIAIGEEGQD